jgi:hypothetical protein
MVLYWRSRLQSRLECRYRDPSMRSTRLQSKRRGTNATPKDAQLENQRRIFCGAVEKGRVLWEGREEVSRDVITGFPKGFAEDQANASASTGRSRSSANKGGRKNTVRKNIRKSSIAMKCR